MIVNMLAAASQFVLVAGTEAPRLQIESSCRSAAQAAVALQRNFDNCMSDENNARDKLNASWANYSDGDKNRCVGMVSTGGPPSYVELLSCLELTRDARQTNAREGDALAPGAGYGGTTPASGATTGQRP